MLLRNSISSRSSTPCLSRLFAESASTTKRVSFNRSGIIHMEHKQQQPQPQPLVGTVSLYHRHLFVCFKHPESWPAQAESADSEALPARLAAAIKSRKNELPFTVRLTLCDEVDEKSRGDVLLFPEAIRYRGLSPEDADSFVEEVLVKGSQDFLQRQQQKLQVGSHQVFVCAHGSRDARCGAAGPVLVQAFDREISKRCMDDRVQVRGCSHVGGHKYAGNVLIFGPSHPGDERLTGQWYGYVTPEDVPELMEQHIGKGQIVEKLWRGQMCLSEEEQKQAQRQRQEMGREGRCSLCRCGATSQQNCGAALVKEEAATKVWWWKTVKERSTGVAAALLVICISVLMYYH